MSDTRRTIVAVILTLLIVCAAWMGSLRRPGAEVDDVSSRDHPDWWRPTGGQNSQDSILERRSLIWNDNGVLDGVDPPAFYTCATYKGKFFTRGCRGMLEEIQIYCRDAGADLITLRYSPHPCLGPIGEVTITPLAGWSWVAAVIEEMWNYDSLFIWVHECEAGTDWAYDAVQPYDGHWSQDTGATWEDMAIRPFIRAVYTGETPGDVPVSGIINIIPIPSTSAEVAYNEVGPLAIGVETPILTIDGAGYCDLILFNTRLPGSEQTLLFVYCDDAIAWVFDPFDLNTYGYTATTPIITLTRYVVNGPCTISLTKKFEFRRRLTVTTMDMGVGGTFAEAYVFPTRIR